MYVPSPPEAVVILTVALVPDSNTDLADIDPGSRVGFTVINVPEVLAFNEQPDVTVLLKYADAVRSPGEYTADVAPTIFTHATLSVLFCH
jgi:hypothetical protein